MVWVAWVGVLRMGHPILLPYGMAEDAVHETPDQVGGFATC